MGAVGHDDNYTYQDLLKHHPCSSCPSDTSSSQLFLTVDELMVLSCLCAYPKGTSPGASKLWAQHLLDTVVGRTAPAAKDCVLSLTHFMNNLLSGKAPPCLVPFGAPLTALLKKGGGVGPIAVGVVLRHLVSHLCCLEVRPSLPNVSLPYGQVSVCHILFLFKELMIL